MTYAHKHGPSNTELWIRPGPMLESGIYDETRPGATVCETCDEMVHTDLNWRGIQYEFTCPVCGEEGQGGL